MSSDKNTQTPKDNEGGYEHETAIHADAMQILEEMLDRACMALVTGGRLALITTINVIDDDGKVTGDATSWQVAGITHRSEIIEYLRTNLERLEEDADAEADKP